MILDRSDSVAPTDSENVSKQLEKFSDSPAAHLVVIGNPIETEPDGFASTKYLSAESTKGDSPLPAAIALAQTLIPAGDAASVTIASDSLATASDDHRAIAALRQNEIPVHWVQLPSVKPVSYTHLTLPTKA